LRGVRKLGPGEALRVRDGRIERHWTWYQLPVFGDMAPPLSEAEAITQVTNGLRAAVQRQLVADVPIGAFLSGGLDSSAVVTFAREAVPDIQCFTIENVGGQEAGDADDLPYAERVAKHLGVPLSVVRVDAAQMAQDVRALILQLDEPLADPAPLNVLYISRLAREHGMKVLLSGSGGDDLFSGYRRHVAAAYQSAWDWIPDPALRLLRRAAAAANQRNPLARRLAKLLHGAELRGDARLANYFLWLDEPDVLQLYTPEFRHSLAGARATQPMIDFIRPLPSQVPTLERLLTLEQRFFLADHNLIYTDKMSMAAGVEVRVPFLDLDLVDIAARTPVRFKQRGRVGKWVLKKAMEPYLPHDVIYRPKTGFGAPLRRWVRHDLRDLFADTLSPERLDRRGVFDSAAVQRLIARNATGRVDAAYTLMALLAIELWCETYLDAPSPRAAPIPVSLG
jgi:asparagine synthase (glutamine-hydrolysing)